MIQTDLYSFSFKQGTLVPWCKSCGASNFYMDGKNGQSKQLYKCKICSFRFVWTSDLPDRRFFSSVINFAVELYTSAIGISYRTLSGVMRKLGFMISHSAIRNWVLQDKTQHFIDDKVNNVQTWYVDETYIKIKGVGYWLWVVYNAMQVLSWHISKKRRIKDARIVLRKAMLIVKKRPEKVITDGLKQYVYAIKKEIGWNWREQKKRHIVDSGIGKNALIERVNREIKRRVKWFSTFQAAKGAIAFFKLFFSNFNRRKALARNTG